MMSPVVARTKRRQIGNGVFPALGHLNDVVLLDVSSIVATRSIEVAMGALTAVAERDRVFHRRLRGNANIP